MKYYRVKDSRGLYLYFCPQPYDRTKGWWWIRVEDGESDFRYRTRHLAQARLLAKATGGYVVRCWRKHRGES